MLNDKENKKIKELIKQGKSNYRIGKETGHSANTINNIREVNTKTEKKPIQEDDIHYTNPIDKTRGIIADIDSLIQTSQLNDKDRTKWEKRVEQLREILKSEGDDRIPKERADAIEKRDQEWNKSVEQNYVKKDWATNLESTLQERDTTITDLRKKIGEKDDLFLKYYVNIQQMQNQIQVQKDENRELNNYIENRLDNDVGQDLEYLKSAQEVFNDEKTCFARYKEEKQSNLKTLSSEVEEKQKAIEIREKELNKREENEQKREDEFETYKNRCYNEIAESITAIKTHVEDIARDHCEKLVKREFDKQINEIAQEWKKIEEAKEQITKEWETLKKIAEEQRTEENDYKN